jgi:hypothetical protein
MIKRDSSSICSLMLAIRRLIKEKCNYSLLTSRLKKSGQRDGIGIMFWPDGTKYEGQFLEDMPHGKGRKIYHNGDYYYGDFERDKAHGFGLFVDIKGGKYEGQWENDL